MVPIENSTAGSINQSYDLLLDYDLTITRKVILRVRHALLARAGVARNDVRRVSSHPAALAQCEKFIPGALYHCLGEFAARAINLTKLESRPNRQYPWPYIFYLDFEGHRDDSVCRAAPSPAFAPSPKR